MRPHNRGREDRPPPEALLSKGINRGREDKPLHEASLSGGLIYNEGMTGLLMRPNYMGDQ